MPDTGFHFASPWWLLGLLLILPVGAWLRRSMVYGNIARINRYADAHLLPHLTGSRELEPRERWRRFGRWALLWSLLVVAMAGPRWDYSEVQLFTPGSDLVVLLDISRSMDVADVRPSRLNRAKQELEDLINQNQGMVRIGLIAFASVAHVVAPITDDGQTIRAILPAIDSNLVRLQGSRLGQALERAQSLFAGQPEKTQHSLLLISDGDFADNRKALEKQIRQLAEGDVRLHILGVGTTDGGPVPGHVGRFLTDSRNRPVESRLEVEELERLAKLGNGAYLSADYVIGGNALSSEEEQVRVWKERFYWLVLTVMLLLLTTFRRHLPAPRGGTK
jgi:Ca-activated chloride channel family protein